MILNYLKDKFEIRTLTNDSFSRINKTNDNFNIYAIASDFINNNRSIFVVLPNLFSAQKYYDNLLNLLPDEDVLFYPADEMVVSNFMIASSDFKYERINTIAEILNNTPKVIVTNLTGILRFNVPINYWRNSIINISVKDEIDRKDLVSRLISLGYEKTYTVYKTGEFSIRGSIIDIFPLNSTNPIRLDFFGDEVDEIKEFDVETQLSINKINNTKIIPVTEFFYTDQMMDEITASLELEINKTTNEEYKTSLNNDLLNLKQRNKLDTLNQYMCKFYKVQSIIEMIDAKKYIVDIDKMKAIHLKNIDDISEYLHNQSIENFILNDYFLDLNIIPDDSFYIDGVVTHDSTFSINAKDIPPYNGNFRTLLKDINNLIGSVEIIIVMEDLNRLKRLKEFLLENNIIYQTINTVEQIDKRYVNLVIRQFALELDSQFLGTYIVTENTIYSSSFEKKKIKYKSIFSNATKINNHDELKIGDFVVHYDFGIGKYIGIKAMKMSDNLKDYLEIQYAKTDVLYIPIENIDRISKYNVHDGREPNLTLIGSSQWTKTKKKVLEKVKDISEKLIKLYAQRSSAEGFIYQEDSPEQLEFENEFMYEETIDQLKAIEAVKSDMESTKPMDRLICGDVGFGKTEVALRASFKAVMNGKQVAYLAPTTLLSRQHFYTFQKRVQSYGMKVELLNRFVTTKQAKIILEQLKSGYIDIIIGTHRLLSKDIVFKDLGLLITDEEQRFGVMHKERIKEMKVNVDSLTLTATPIPRTLQMSIMGIKDLSTIETPPKNRYPVQTYVTPRNDSITKEAIEREIIRGGQVFYMYNYTEDIIDVASYLQKLVPEARVKFAHGKMNKNELEDIISEFIDHQFDVLVCTTIIETGIDIPDTNTLLIHDADRLGLSQLYQLRGRVGRSDRIAYAYLMYEPRKVLTENAMKRLESIQEFTQLGSGYKIAMKDLAIRGAGDVLGQEQSGFMDSIGIELYMRILNDTLTELKGEKVDNEPKNNYTQVYSNRTINDEYINNEDIKIEIHKKIRTITSINNLIGLQLELEDRFGKFDDELLMYMYEKLFFNLCQILDIYQIIDLKNEKKLCISKEKTQTLNGEYILKQAYEKYKSISIRYASNEFHISIDLTKYKQNSWLIDTCTFLDKIV